MRGLSRGDRGLTRGEHRYEWDDGLRDWVCTCGYTHKELCNGTLEAI